MRPTNLLPALSADTLLCPPLAARGRRAAVQVAAQPNDRAGYSFSVGLGGGSNGYSCPNCVTDRQNGGSGSPRAGQGVAPRLVRGVELNGWNKTKNNVTGRTGMLSAIAQWYPSTTNGFFAKGGLGVGRTTL